MGLTFLITGKNANNTNATAFFREYSTRHTNAGVRLTYPLLIGTIAEAVYLLGAERNPNVVKLSSYAPSLTNLILPPRHPIS
jgi:alpha-N-arabinofuranosidase